MRVLLLAACAMLGLGMAAPTGVPARAAVPTKKKKPVCKRKAEAKGCVLGDSVYLGRIHGTNVSLSVSGRGAYAKTSGMLTCSTPDGVPLAFVVSAPRLPTIGKRLTLSVSRYLQLDTVGQYSGSFTATFTAKSVTIDGSGTVTFPDGGCTLGLSGTIPRYQ